VLEQELGCSLFRMNGRRLALTDEAQTLYPIAGRLLDEYAHLRAALTKPAAVRPTLRFCSHSVFTTYFIGHALKHHFGDAEAFVQNCVPGEIEASIARRESDIGLTYFPVATEGVQFLPVVNRVETGIFVRRNHPIPFEQMPCSEPLARIRNAALRPSTIDAWPEQHLRPLARYHVDLLETALELCRQGLSWGFFPLFVVWLHNLQVKKEFELERIAMRSPRGAEGLRVFLVKRAGDPETPEARRLCKALRLLCKEAALALRV
jgi:DNA-binding transcriptional LysR family regulator